MTISADILRFHLDYSAWASLRLLEAARQLSAEDLTRDFGASEKSVLGTLVHIFAADRAWLGRLAGKPPTAFVSPEDYRMEVLESDWPKVLDGWREFAAGLTDESGAAVQVYKDLGGREWRMPLWQPLMHVVNHGTHHRGQVAGFLRALGHKPPRTDLVIYYREIG